MICSNEDSYYKSCKQSIFLQVLDSILYCAGRTTDFQRLSTPVNPKHLVILQEAVGRLLNTRATDKRITTVTLCKGNSAYTGTEVRKPGSGKSTKNEGQLDDQVTRLHCPQQSVGNPLGILSGAAGYYKVDMAINLGLKSEILLDTSPRDLRGGIFMLHRRLLPTPSTRWR